MRRYRCLKKLFLIFLLCVISQNVFSYIYMDSQIKKLTIRNMNFSNLDTDFWDDKTEIEYLYMENVDIQNFSFLEYLPNLIAISVISDDTHPCEIWENQTIDFINNKKLEYFEITNMFLKSLPEFSNIPDTLSYVIICNNLYHDYSYSNQYGIFQGTNAMLYLDDWLINDHPEISELPLSLKGNYGVKAVLYNMN